MRMFRFGGAIAVISAFAALQVHAAHSVRMPDSRMGSSAACEAAKRSAWFERQRQLTDGDVDPSKALPTPRECTVMEAMQSGDVKREEAAARASERTTAEASQEGRVY